MAAGTRAHDLTSGRSLRRAPRAPPRRPQEPRVFRAAPLHRPSAGSSTSTSSGHRLLLRHPRRHRRSGDMWSLWWRPRTKQSHSQTDRPAVSAGATKIKLVDMTHIQDARMPPPRRSSSAQSVRTARSTQARSCTHGEASG